MIITKVTRDGLLKLAKEKRIYLEGTLLKVIESEKEDTEFVEYLNICKEKDNTTRRKRLDITKQVQQQNKELEAAAKENECLMAELKVALEDAQKAEEEAKLSANEASTARKEAEKLRDDAMEDLDTLQKRTQFELMGRIVRVALMVILGVGLLTTALFTYSLVAGLNAPILESTWSNLFGILLTNSFSIIGTIMGIKYTSEKGS